MIRAQHNLGVGTFGDSPAAAGSGRPAEVLLTVSAVARRLGLAPATLRTWDRRYGLGPSGHSAGSHRRYTATDVDRLARVRRLTLEGVPPADAARLVLAGEQDGVPRSTVTAPPLPGGPDRASEVEIGRPGGGRVIPLPGGGPTARGLARAAMALDAAACLRLLTEQLRTRGVVPTWQDVARPVLHGVGERWQATGKGVEVEHLLSECLLAALDGRALSFATPVNARPLLLACAEQEMHTLPLHALAAALAERHVATRMLGARVPGEALVDAVRRSGPLAVLIWSQSPGTADAETLASLPRMRPAPFVLVAGPGWEGQELPRGVTRVFDLPEAVARLAAVAGA